MCGMALLLVITLQYVTGDVSRFDGFILASDAAPEPAPVARPATVTGHAVLTSEEAGILFAIAHRTADASHASALFAPKSWYTPPPPPPPAPQVEVVPTAPPLPFTFLGSFTDASNETVYFLTRDDRVYDVKPGDVIDSIYSVAAVENGQLVILYKPLDTRQMLAIGVNP
jgi:hypothetical protein